MWASILIASLSTFMLKTLGYFLPDSLLSHKVAKKVIAVLPIGLLSGLIALQLFTTKDVFILDGRIVGALSALGLLMMRAPFILVITISALITAVGRARGYWA